jgi:hypothetical protein
VVRGKGFISWKRAKFHFKLENVDVTGSKAQTRALGNELRNWRVTHPQFAPTSNITSIGAAGTLSFMYAAISSSRSLLCNIKYYPTNFTPLNAFRYQNFGHCVDHRLTHKGRQLRIEKAQPIADIALYDRCFFGMSHETQSELIRYWALRLGLVGVAAAHDVLAVQCILSKPEAPQNL